MKINFVEGESYISDYGLGSKGEYTPIYVKLGNTKRFFMNRVKQLTGDSYSWLKCRNERNIVEVENAKESLIIHDGKYIKFHAINDDPFDFLKWVKENNYTLEVVREFFQTASSGDFTDFHGNTCEYSCSFHYRIYDKKMIDELKRIVSEMKQHIR